MHLQPHIQPVPQQGFQQFKGRGGLYQKLALQPALGMFVDGDRVRHNASADPHACDPVLQHYRADRNVEHRGTAGRGKADRSAIDPAPPRLKFGDDLHGSRLWRAGHGAAGEECAEHRLERNRGLQHTSDGGGHLE